MPIALTPEPLVVGLQLIPLGHPNRPGIKIPEVKAIVVHYTGNNNPGATDIANLGYMGRSYVKTGNNYFEVDRVTPFRFGSAHVFCDEDSITEGIPLDEVAYGVGDRAKPYTEEFKGQQPIAKVYFNNQQNFSTLSVEICNNASWDKACENAIKFIRKYLKDNNLIANITLSKMLAAQDMTAPPLNGKSIPIIRHFDLSGKICPKPFVDDSNLWFNFLDKI